MATEPPIIEILWKENINHSKESNMQKSQKFSKKIGLIKNKDHFEENQTIMKSNSF